MGIEGEGRECEAIPKESGDHGGSTEKPPSAKEIPAWSAEIPHTGLGLVTPIASSREQA